MQWVPIEVARIREVLRLGALRLGALKLTVLRLGVLRRGGEMEADLKQGQWAGSQEGKMYEQFHRQQVPISVWERQVWRLLH